VLLLREMGQWIQVQYNAGRLSDVRVQAMDGTLNELTAYHGGCERIASTPIPYAYSVLLHRTVYVYCTLLPFSLLDSAGVLTPLISVLISYAFMALDAIASELEEPFGTEPNDLALDALCVTIERTLLEMNDVADVPPAMCPNEHYVLT
jgi:putative membrane protein